MPSPSEAAKRAAGTYLARGRRFATIDLNDRDKLAEQFDAFAAVQVEAAVAAARAEMRERCAEAAKPQNAPMLADANGEGVNHSQGYWKGRMDSQRAIRALPLDPEVTK